MPWYFALLTTLFLFLLAPFFRKWVDLVIWPRIADWWASRSRVALEKRVLKLEAILTRIEPLPILTEFENLVLRSINGIFGMLTMMPIIALVAYIGVFSEPTLLLSFPKDWRRQIVLLLLAVLVGLIGIGMGRFIDQFCRERSSEYKTSIRDDINALRARLH
jgi:hypothetical protein